MWTDWERGEGEREEEEGEEGEGGRCSDDDEEEGVCGGGVLGEGVRTRELELTQVSPCGPCWNVGCVISVGVPLTHL